jgi:oligoendopeptidase F
MASMTQDASALPHWDLSPFFPSLQSDEFGAAFSELAGLIDELEAALAKMGIEAGPPIEHGSQVIATFEELLAAFDRSMRSAHVLDAYIYGYVSTDSRDELAQARQSDLEQQELRLNQLITRLTAWIGRLDVEALISASPAAAEHAHMLRKAKVQSEHLMAPELEVLAAELDLTGARAWGHLHGNHTSQLIVEVPIEGSHQLLPMSAVRNLATHSDRQVRREAYQAEVAAWERAALPLAAALNSIKGQVNTLSRRRNWETPLDQALFINNIDRPTFEAMIQAADDSLPDFRRYLLAKARLLGLRRLAWYDIEAPLPGDARQWAFSEASAFIVEQFATFSPRLSQMAERAFGEHWIDAEPRQGKRDGAFCMWVRDDESRVLSNYATSYDGVSTIAHELGHAYHNLNLAGRTIFQRSTPMVLAETASIFCETIVRKAAMRRANEQEKLIILEASLQNACAVVVDITSRYLFESRLFKQRRQRELTIDELNQAMLQAQLETYGEVLEAETRHPYMWAVKPHYYSATRSFYNFPYMFGLLFGLGLYALYEREPEAFRQRYDSLLSSTGMGMAPDLAAQFGFDLRSPDFWGASLDVVRGDIAEFEAAARAAS